MNFFDSLYFILYSSSKKTNGAPEIPVLGFISFCQTNNVLTILNLLFYTLNFNVIYKIHHYYFILQILLYIINYYYYETRKNGELILRDKNILIIKPYLIYLYIIISIFLTGLTYYILREY